MTQPDSALSPLSLSLVFFVKDKTVNYQFERDSTGWTEAVTIARQTRGKSSVFSQHQHHLRVHPTNEWRWSVIFCGDGKFGNFLMENSNLE